MSNFCMWDQIAVSFSLLPKSPVCFLRFSFVFGLKVFHLISKLCVCVCAFFCCIFCWLTWEGGEGTREKSREKVYCLSCLRIWVKHQFELETVCNWEESMSPKLKTRNSNQTFQCVNIVLKDHNDNNIMSIKIHEPRRRPPRELYNTRPMTEKWLTPQ